MLTNPTIPPLIDPDIILQLLLQFSKIVEEAHPTIPPAALGDPIELIVSPCM